MRIGIAVDYGSYAKATSLNLIAKKIFLELGRIMNQTKSFTITALRNESIGIGDVNQHYDCISIPNMGGYKFPRMPILSSNNVIIGLIGIDEVILGEQVFRTKEDWNVSKTIIEKEIPKWEKYIDKIKLIHVATNSEKEQMIKYLKIPEDKIKIIPLGVEHEIFTPPSDKEKTRKKILGKFYIKDKPYFIHVSETNFARKNILRTIEAFKKAKNEGIKHNLIIVGKAEQVVYKAAQSVNGVYVMGFVSEKDLIELMQGADALIFPSLHEGFGLPSVEAMACGIPVLTSNVFSPPEIVGDAGIFVNPYNVSDITNKIVDISRNESMMKSLSKNAIERSKKFSWENTAKTLLETIEKNTITDSNSFDFDESLDLAAYRTLCTVCQITPGLREMSTQDLLEFNYSRIISWAIESGLENPDVKDFLLPFKGWLESHAV